MKRLVFIVLCFFVSIVAKAQIVTISSDMFRNPESEVKIKLIDSITQKPLQLATVYLQPKGDTTIMYFNLSDTSGTAVLKEVVRGSYILTAEFLGYRPYVKDYYFSKKKEDLGVVQLVEDAVLLEAATVSAVGNPIEIIKDTIVYNATMFRTADNAVLGELLKKMPGFEVSSSGQVKVNGEEVSKITVNGRTFFFEDPSMAVKNLPAKIVDKIKITDYKSDQEKATGIVNMGSKSKEMDIALKKEYEKGWFGNAKIAGGTPIASSKNSNQPLIVKRDALYNGNVMVSGYNEKDQVTFIGSANNVEDIGANDMIIINVDATGSIQAARPSDGVSSNRQAGVNFNSSRIKGYNTNAVVNYKGESIESENIYNRTTLQENAPSIYTSTNNNSRYDENLLNASFELVNKDKTNHSLRIYPAFKYNSVKQDSYKDINTYNQQPDVSSASSLLNQSSASNYIESDYFNHFTSFTYTRSNWGKKNRSLSVSADYDINFEDSQKKEYSTLLYSNGVVGDTRDLYYKSAMSGGGYEANITYVEPIATNWRLSTRLASELIVSNVVSDAYRYSGAQRSFNAGFDDKDRYSIYDDYYSSVSEYRYLLNSARVLAQYSKGKATIQFGGYVEAVNNENYSKTYGLEQTTGKGEYLWNWSPFARIQLTDKKGATYYVNYSGSSSNLTNNQISPVPDISNPTNISFGNIYLEPEFRHSLDMYTFYTNKKDFKYIHANVFLYHVSNNIVNANWFDDMGVQYNVPVNSTKGSWNGRLSFYLHNVPLNKERSFTFNIGATANLSLGHSYQNIRQGNGIDLDNFDYSVFMSNFWGNSSGDLFYSGLSGFKESRTINTTLTANLDFKYKGEILNCSLGANVKNNRMDYSLNKNANINTWDYTIDGNIQIDTKNKFSFVSSIEYNLYSGYSQGYGKPNCLWNFEAHKTIKSITLSVKVNDILNQTTSFRHTTTANYVEDSYRGIIGRRFLIGITFNFGKMNTSKNRAAARSAVRMMM